MNEVQKVLVLPGNNFIYVSGLCINFWLSFGLDLGFGFRIPYFFREKAYWKNYDIKLTIIHMHTYLPSEPNM